MLKNGIDTVFGSYAFRSKPAGTVAYSGGRIAGARAVEHLALIAVETEMVPLRNAVLIPTVTQTFNPDGSPRDPSTEAAAYVLFDDLAWWADALHQARSRDELAPRAFGHTMQASTTTVG